MSVFDRILSGLGAIGAVGAVVQCVPIIWGHNPPYSVLIAALLLSKTWSWAIEAATGRRV